MNTVTPIIMSGIFAPLANEFIAFKQAQGYKYYGEAKLIRQFCRFAEEYNLTKPVLTKELVMDWIAVKDGEAAKTRLHRISILNQFGKFLTDTGHEAYIPPSGHWHTDSFTPYIFSHEEIAKLFYAADHIRPIAQSRNIHKELPILFRLLYSCGLRVSEAVSLQCKDVDLNQGILTLHETKNGKDRLIPMSTSMIKMCSAYRQDVIAFLEDDDYFFPAPDRTMLSPNTIYQRFRRILWDANIHYGGKGNGPRLHDLRHTFAVHTLQNWVECGEDLTSMLPVLSVFMGHKSIRATSNYLRLTAEVYPNITQMVNSVCAYVIPEEKEI